MYKRQALVTAINLVDAAANTSVVFTGANTFAASLTAVADAITFGAGATLTTQGAVSDVTLTSGGALALPTNLTSGRDLFLTAGGAVTQAGPLAASNLSVVKTAAGNINLSNVLNTVPGTVTFSGPAATINWANASSVATAPNIAGVTGLNNYTLTHVNAPVALPATTITGTLTVTAFGDLTQSGPLTAATGAFTVTGNAAITLTNAANDLGTVGFNATRSTQAVQFVDADDVALGASNLARAGLTLTAGGNVTQTGALTQLPSAGPVAVTLTGGTTIDLSNGANFLGGPVTLGGPGLTTVSVRTDNPLARYADYTLPAGPTVSQTVQHDNAPVVLPALTLQNLTVTGTSVGQLPATALVVGNNSSFTSTLGAIGLDAPGNDFASVGLATTGRFDVSIRDANAIDFVNSTVGSGRLSVTAGGAITQSGFLRQTAGLLTTDRVTLTSTGGPITLNSGTNRLRGPVDAAVPAGQGVTLQNQNTVPLILGDVVTSSLTVTGGAISQDPGRALTVTGAAPTTVTGTTVVLGNAGNNFSGPVALTATTAEVRDVGPLQFAASAVSGTLVAAAGGPVTQVGAITDTPTVTIDAGANAITLVDPANNFDTFSATAGGAVAVRDSNTLVLGELRLGVGTLTVTAGGDVTQVGRLIQTGPGAITIDSTSGTAANRDVALDNVGNEFLGTLRTTNATALDVQNRHDVVFDDTAVVTGSLDVVAGKTIDLPSAALTVTGDIDLTASRVLVPADLSAPGGLTLTGRTEFTGNRTLSAAAGAEITGDVTTTGNLSFPAGELTFSAGTWAQDGNALTVGDRFTIGVAGVPRTMFRLGGAGSLTADGVTVVAGATFQAGTTDGVAETVAVNTGATEFFLDGNLRVGLGATNDRLAVTGAGGLDLDALLVGTGLAGATPSPVVTATGPFAGQFGFSVVAGQPVPFRAGSDIVVADYGTAGQVSVGQGGVEDADGVVTGWQSDGDGYRVKTSLGGAGRLVIVENPLGEVEAVVRNNSAASTLAVELASALGDGVVRVAGVAVNGPGAVTITGPAASFNNGTVQVQNQLTAFTARDLTNTRVTAGGSPASGTAVTVRDVSTLDLTVGGTVSAFTARNASGSNRFEAERFGTIKTTGDLAAGRAGDLFADLVTRAAPGTVPVVGTVSVAGQLRGAWDVAGGVGTVTARSVNDWDLGGRLDDADGGGGLRNPDGLTTVGVLKFGQVQDARVAATGLVKSVTAGTWTGAANSSLRAGSFGTIAVTGNPATNERGNADFRLTATGNSGATKLALDKLTVADNFPATGAVALEFRDGNVNSITAGRVFSGTVSAWDTPAGGRLGSLKAGTIIGSAVSAESVGSVAATGNDAAGIFGDIGSTTVTTSGVGTTGIGIGTVAASRNISGSAFSARRGNLTAVAAGLQLTGTTVTAAEATTAALGSVTAASMSGATVTARTIGRVSTAGAKLVRPNRALDLGTVAGSRFTAFAPAGTTAALGSLSVFGDLTGSAVVAPTGIGPVTVGRSLVNSEVIADRFQSGAEAVGSVGGLTAGLVSGSVLKATSFGALRATGYNVPDQGTSSTASRVDGRLTGVTVLATGSRKGLGVASLTLDAGAATADVVAPAGVGPVLSGGALSVTRVVADGPAAKIGAVTGTDVGTVTMRAAAIGKVTVNPSPRFGLAGLIGNTELTARQTTGTGVAGLAVAGSAIGLRLTAPATVPSVAVAGTLSSSTVAAGFAPGAALTAVKAGDISGTTLVARQLGSLTTTGQPANNLIGNVTSSFVNVIGNNAGVGVGKVVLKGKLDRSVVDVSDGDVTAVTAAGMWNSTIQVGARYTKGNSVDAAVTFDAPTRRLKVLTLTAPFAGATAPAQDQFDSGAFRDSYVAAPNLGTVTIPGAVTDPAGDTETQGVAFRTGGSAGVVKVAGATVADGTTIAASKFRKAGN